jgi:hypothetical protein
MVLLFPSRYVAKHRSPLIAVFVAIVMCFGNVLVLLLATGGVRFCRRRFPIRGNGLKRGILLYGVGNGSFVGKAVAILA